MARAFTAGGDMHTRAPGSSAHPPPPLLVCYTNRGVLPHTRGLIYLQHYRSRCERGKKTKNSSIKFLFFRENKSWWQPFFSIGLEQYCLGAAILHKVSSSTLRRRRRRKRVKTRVVGSDGEGGWCRRALRISRESTTISIY